MASKRDKRVQGHASGDFGESSKKSRLTADVDFPKFPERLLNKTLSSLHRIIAASDACYTLTPLKICNCNAGDVEKGNSFSNAHCSILPVAPAHMFGSVFEAGVDVLLDYLHSEKIPEDVQQQLLLRKLVEYISDTDTQALLENAVTTSESDLAVILANHLFGMLASSPGYTLDKSSKKKPTDCPCQIVGCKLKGSYGDTSIGNEEVWHGKLDILFNNDVIVEPVGEAVKEDREHDDDSPGGKSPVEDKLKTTDLNREQIIAETIVFSFLQKQRHPKSANFLFPCIGVSQTDLFFYFYDSNHDVLLESSKISLVVGHVGAYKVNMHAVLTSWLVINYKYLCSGLTDAMRAPEKKADFFAQARSKLDIYEHNLKMGDIGNPKQGDTSCVEVDNTDPIRKRNDKLFDIMKKEYSSRNISEVKYS